MFYIFPTHSVKEIFYFYSDEMELELVRHSNLKTSMKKLNKLLQDLGEIRYKLRMKYENMIWGEGI